jgi:hypothetical protein
MVQENFIERTLSNMEKRRDNILKGNINSLPPPFPRFANDFIGFEQGTYLGITSFTKGSKTQFTLHLLFESLYYTYHNKNKARLKVFYYPLEETPERILHRFMSWILFKEEGIRIAPRDLRSSRNEYPLDLNIIELFKTKYKDYLDYFNQVFVFSTTSNPTGIYKECKRYAEENGICHMKGAKYKNEIGELVDTKILDWYEQNDPSEYRIIVIDHIGLIDTERGMSLKQSIDKASEYCAKELRNKYNFIPIVIQQQSSEIENNDSFKLGRIRPSGQGLSDSKYTQRDCNILMGLFSPFKFGLREYLGYDITKFKDSIRFLEILVNRDAEMGGIIALFFDGATCTFKELPKPDDTENIQKVYQLLDNMRNTNNSKNFFTFSTILNKNKNKIKKLFKTTKKWQKF